MRDITYGINIIVRSSESINTPFYVLLLLVENYLQFCKRKHAEGNRKGD